MLTTRRTLMGKVARPAIALVVSAYFAKMPNGNAEETQKRKVPFRWNVSAAYSEMVKSNLKFEGRIEQERNAKGLPLVVIFVGIALLPSLADAILKLRNKLIQPGLKIDTRGDEIKIDIDPDLPRAVILLVDKSGARLIEPNELSSPADLLKALSEFKGK